MAAVGVPDVKEQLLKGMQGRQQDLQGPSRRLQHHGSLAGKAPDRATNTSTSATTARWSGCASSSGRSFCGAARRRLRRLAGAVRDAAAAEDLQPSLGSVREGDVVGMDYQHWRADRLFLLVPAQEYVAKFLATFKEYPPSQKVGSFSLDKVMETLQNAQTSGK
jgi:arylsulfatase